MSNVPVKRTAGRRRTLSIAAAAIILHASCMYFASPLRADTIWIASGGGGSVPFANVSILRVQDGQIVFRTQAGTEATRPLEHVARIELDGQPLLNTAEAAFAAGQWARAADAYQQAFQRAQQPWLRQWTSVRLLESANRSGQFPAAVAGYIAAVTVDPARAVEHRPDPTHQAQQDLDSAAQRLGESLQIRNLQSNARQALLSLLMEVHRARADTAEAARAANQLIDLAGRQADANDPATRRMLADARLILARLAIDQQQYQQALEQIEPHRRLFTEPRQQSTALFCIAEAKAGLAADSNDPQVHQDVALAYMRVVAHFGDRPDDPNVPEALQRVARIHEQKLGEPDTAHRLYQQLAEQYKDHPTSNQQPATNN